MLDQRISASTQRFAVLGESLAHTCSPQIHNTLFAAAGLDAIYLPITVPKAQLSSAVDVLRSCFGGFNVTIPYKERIIPLLDELDAAADACGAVNTGKFCSECGAKKPSDEWTCACGAVNKGKFCSECGAKRPE